MLDKLATYPFETCDGVVFLLIVQGVIDECKSGRSATAEFGLESKDCDTIFLRLNRLRKSRLEIFLRDAGHFWVKNVDGLNRKVLTIES